MKSNTQYKQTEIGEIPEGWSVETIENLSNRIVSGGTPSRKHKEYYSNGTIPWIKTQELNDTYIFEAEEKITEEALANSSAKIVPSGAITLAMYGATVGKLGILGIDASTNQACCNIEVNNKLLSNLFLFYSLLNRRSDLINLASGAAQQNLNVGAIRSFRIALPEISEQQQIASILSSLDDKIELNRRMNKTLEEIGKALFKRWFVDFEFPNENGEPYKSSGGEMVESELGEIPKGWEATQLRDFGEIVCGKTPPKSNKDFFDGDIPFIKIPDMHGNTFIVNTEDSLSQDGLNHQKNKTLPEGSICVSCIATVGLVSITSKTSQTNQQINSIIPKSDNTRAFLYFTLKQMEKTLQDFASGGSATLNLNTGSFSAITVNKPHLKTLNEFHQITEEIFHQILLNMKEISKLSSIRDSLLPRLMSGKMRVN